MKTTRVAMLALVVVATVQASLPEATYVGGARLPAIDGPVFGGASFGGGAATLTRIPTYLQHAGVRYFDVDAAAAAAVSLAPERPAAAPARRAGTLAGDTACGRGWAKHPTKSECFESVPGHSTKNWGWTNKIAPGEDLVLPVFVGASDCEGTDSRFDIRVTYAGGDVVIDLTPSSGDKLQSASVYVGTTPLPVTAKGGYTDSPGAFPIRLSTEQNAVVSVTEALSDLAIAGELYFAVHVNVCPGEEAEAEAMEVFADVEVPACTTTFFVAVFSCNVDPACVQRTTGNVQQDLIAAGFASYTDAVHFTLPATDAYQHNTRIYARTLDESDAAVEIPTSPLMGIFAAGCGVDAVAVQVPANIGPVQNLCGQMCPVGP